MQLGIARPVEVVALEEVVVGGHRLDLVRAALHRLEEQEVPGDVLVDEVEREQRVAQVVEHPEEEHEVEALVEGGDVVDRELAELDVHAAHLGGEARLGEIAVVEIHGDHPVGAAPLHLDGVEAGVAADVEHGPPAQVARHRLGEVRPLVRRIVVQEMLGRGGDAAEVEVVEPRPEVGDPGADVLFSETRHRSDPSLRQAAAPPARDRR